MNEHNKLYTCTRCGSTRVRKETWKRTVSITLPQKLIEQAKNQGLNISKVTETALSLIIDYMQTQNNETTGFLDQPSFLKKVVAGPTGIEPAAYGLRVRRSSLTELRAHGNFSRKRTSVKRYRAYGYVPRFHADVIIQGL